jgi:phage baseplate assembly protein W
MAALTGTDLAVVPNMVAHDAASLDLTSKVRVLRRVRPGEPGAPVDLSTLTGRENLAQALLLWLLTPRGALSTLGHAAYGSRLSELIGRQKSEELRNLCRAFVLEAAAQEPRIEARAVEVRFELGEERFDNFVFTLAVSPIAGGDTVALSLEVGL